MEEQLVDVPIAVYEWSRHIVVVLTDTTRRAFKFFPSRNLNNKTK